jgi:predicted RNA-binding Zn-ribbon protein involved in translation (DUF1610 family)
MSSARIFDDAGELQRCPNCGGRVDIVRRTDIYRAPLITFECKACGRGDVLMESRKTCLVYWERRNALPWIVSLLDEPWGEAAPWPWQR